MNDSIFTNAMDALAQNPAVPTFVLYVMGAYVVLSRDHYGLMHGCLHLHQSTYDLSPRHD